jgi:GNAT superfamily N-acetyltransferase
VGCQATFAVLAGAADAWNYGAAAARMPANVAGVSTSRFVDRRVGRLACELYRLAVSPEHRRKGLATMLLSEGGRRLRERGDTRRPWARPGFSRTMRDRCCPGCCSTAGLRVCSAPDAGLSRKERGH